MTAACGFPPNGTTSPAGGVSAGGDTAAEPGSMVFGVEVIGLFEQPTAIMATATRLAVRLRNVTRCACCGNG
jgi:hypothetical protein